MELKSLINLPNQYPDNRDIKESYAQKNSEITYTGKFKKNQIYFSDIPIENINVVDGVSFNFLVEFNSEREKYYTSQTFLDNLEKARRGVNPYINKSTIPIIFFDDELIDGYSEEPKFKIAEDYAEVAVTDTLNNKSEYLSHLNYLIQPDRGNSPLKKASEMGSWTLEITDKLGMDHEQQLDNLENTEPNYAETEPVVEIASNTNSNVTGTSPGQQANPYPPVGYPGGLFKKTAIHEGVTYKWNKQSKSWEPY